MCDECRNLAARRPANAPPRVGVSAASAAEEALPVEDMLKACEALAAEFTKEYAGPPPEDEPDEEDEDDEDEDEEEDDESRGGVKGKSSGKEEGGTGGAEEDDAAAYADVD